jgi:phospholipase C
VTRERVKGPVQFGNRIAEYGKLSWEMMPQRLQAAGVSWKVYSDRLCELALSPLPYFKAFTDPCSITPRCCASPRPLAGETRVLPPARQRLNPGAGGPG